jgi:hypothetical protein
MRYIFYFVAGLSALTAIYHAAGIFTHIDNSPVWRHSLFFCLAIAGVPIFLKRPFWLIYPMILLTIQQLYSHGTYLWLKLTAEHSIHWLSVADIILLPVITYLVWYDQEMRSK